MGNEDIFEKIGNDEEVVLWNERGWGVEGMMEKIIGERDGVDVDEVVVVSFRNVGGGEMRGRIGE